MEDNKCHDGGTLYIFLFWASGHKTKSYFLKQSVIVHGHKQTKYECFCFFLPMGSCGKPNLRAKYLNLNAHRETRTMLLQ